MSLSCDDVFFLVGRRQARAFSRAAKSLRKHKQDAGAASAGGSPDRRPSYVYSSDKVLEVKREIEKTQNTPRKAVAVNKTSFL